VTWGLMSEMGLALGVTAAELEGKAALRLGVSAERRLQRARGQLEGMGRLSKALEGLSIFRQAGECATRVPLGS
jgi:hypothetical protein